MTAVWISAMYPTHKPRLQRLNFTFSNAPLYFLTLCTDQRRTLLDNHTAYECFKEFCHLATDHGVYVGRYVLMPDHIHLFAQVTAGSPPVSPWIKSLKNSLSKNWRTKGFASPHWQKGFFDHVIRSADSYAEKWDYVAANPVRAGLVPTAEQWPFQGRIHDIQYER